MKRHEFITVLGVSAGTVFFAPFLTSCSKDSDTTPNPPPGGGGGAVDFTLDLTLPANSALTSNGGFLIKSGVIVARISAVSFAAVASACTHEGFTLAFDSPNNRFHCANHGSNFGLTGAVINGPAATALKLYNTTLTGTSLRVFA